MRKLLVTCLIALLALAASAQTNPRSNAQPAGSTRTSLSPSTSQPKGGDSSSQTDGRSPQTLDNKATKSRLDANPAGATQPTSPRSTTARPSEANSSSNTTTTTRGIGSTIAKNAPEVAAVNPVRVKWMSLEDALEKSKTDKRKIFVDVYTDWCGWCKRMDSTTFMNPAVVQYLNDNYYPVKFNAEQQKEILYKDKTYQFKKNGASGHHELAAEWLNNRLTYPTVVFLDENQGVIQPLPGFQDAAKMEAVLNYFGTDSHKKTPWESYLKNYKQEKD